MDAPKNHQNSITLYSMAEECIVGQGGNDRMDYDLLTVMMLCLGKEGSENYDGILKLLEVLLSSEKRPEEKKDILNRDFDIQFSEPMDKEAMAMCNLSQGIEDRGVQRGIQHGIMESLKNLIASTGWDVEQAMNALGIPETDRAKYAAAL